jgi:hypothetical protein
MGVESLFLLFLFGLGKAQNALSLGCIYALSQNPEEDSALEQVVEIAVQEINIAHLIPHDYQLTVEVRFVHSKAKQHQTQPRHNKQNTTNTATT